MTTHEAKADVKRRLLAKGVPYGKLTAKTVSFEGFGYGSSAFVTIHGARYNGLGTHLKAEVFADVPKPSDGGYVVDFKDCHWQHRD